MPSEVTKPSETPEKDAADAEPQPSAPARVPTAPILAMPTGRGRNSGSSLAERLSAAWLPLLIGAAIGVGIGVAVMRHRAEARTTVVVVNGVKITQQDLFGRLQQVAGIQTMHRMVEEELQLQFAQKKGLAPTDADVDARYAEMSRKPGFAQKLEAAGQSESSLKRALRVQMAQAAVLTQGVDVTEADARAFYAAQSSSSAPQALFYRPDVIGLQAISTATPESAAKALRELNAGTPFSLVVSGYSLDASKNNGGTLPPLQRGRSPLHSNPALEDAVFHLAVGSRLGPVAYNHTWWIFQCTNKNPSVAVPYSEVKDECRRDALLLKGRAINGKKVNDEFQGFEKASNLQAFWPFYKSALGGS